MASLPFVVIPTPLGTVASGNALTEKPASHLGEFTSPGMTWKSSGDTNLWVRGDFGQQRTIDFMTMLQANAQAGTQIRLRLGDTQAEVDGGAAPYDSGAVDFIDPSIFRQDDMYGSHLELGTATACRWWRVDISGHVGDFEASTLVMGERLTPATWYSPGWSMGVEDLGDIDFGRYGVVDIQTGLKFRTFNFRLGWLSEADFEDKFRPLIEKLGNSDVAFWCFDPSSSIYRQSKSFFGWMRGALGATHSRNTPSGIRYEQEFDVLCMLARGPDQVLLPVAGDTPPAITGTISVGGRADVSTGSWAFADSFTYQWLADVAAISGATANTYLFTEDEYGAEIEVDVTAVNEYGSVTVRTAAVGPLLTYSFDFEGWLASADGAFYEIMPGDVFTDTAGTTQAVEGDSVELIKVTAGNMTGAYDLVFSGTKPTFVKRGDYWGLSIPTTGMMATATAAFTADTDNCYLLAAIERVTDNAGTVFGAMASNSAYFRMNAQATMRILGQLEAPADNSATSGVTDDYPLGEAHVLDLASQAGQISLQSNQGTARTDANAFNGETIASCRIVLNGTYNAGVLTPSGNEMIVFGLLIANKAPGADRSGMQVGMAALGGALVEINALVGDVTSTGAKIMVQSGSVQDVRLRVSTNPNLSSPILTSYQSVSDLKRFSVSGLSAGTQYYFRGETLAQISGITGQFKTPATGATVRLIVGSCSGEGANNGIYNLIVGQDPDFILHLGDFHYNNPGTLAAHIEGYVTYAFGYSRQRLFMRSAPFLYTWDDHDFAGNNSYGGSFGRDTAVGFFRDYVPSPDLAESSATAPVYWSRTIDVDDMTVRIIATDNRSARSINSATDDSSKVMLGATQEAWFQLQLAEARDNKEAVIWMQSQAFIGASADGWPVYTTERNRHWQYFKDEDLYRRMFTLAGDNHFSGLDDGTNHEFVSGAPVPSILSSPFHKDSSTPSGTWSHGSWANQNQFVQLDLSSDGRNILTVAATAYTISVSSLSSLGTMTFERDVSLFPANLLTDDIGAVFDAAAGETLFTDTAGTTPATVSGDIERTNDLGRHYMDMVTPSSGASPILEQSGSFYRRAFDGVDDRCESSASFTLALPLYIGLMVEKGGQTPAMFYTGSGSTFRVRIVGQSNGGVGLRVRIGVASEHVVNSPSDVMPLNTPTRVEALVLPDGTAKLIVNGTEYTNGSHPYTSGETVANSIIGNAIGAPGLFAPTNGAQKLYREFFGMFEPTTDELADIRTWLDAGA